MFFNKTKENIQKNKPVTDTSTIRIKIFGVKVSGRVIRKEKSR